MGDTPPGVLGTDPPVVAADAGASPAPGAARSSRGPTGTCSDARPATGLQICGWPRQIGWGEFRELTGRPEGVEEDAEIHSEGSGDDNMPVIRSGGFFRIGSVRIDMTVEDDSWVVKGKQSDYLLNHEQGHFDITALLWRDLANDILSVRARTSDSLGREVNRIMDRYRPIFDRMTEQYDEETNHSLNREAQRRWDERIRNAIERGTRFVDGR